MSRFNKIIFAAIIGLGLVIGLLSIASARLGPTVDTLITVHEMDGSSIGTPIEVSFSEPMNVRSVEQNFRIVPHTSGSFNWSGNQLVFEPTKPLSYSTRYTVSIGSGATSTGGRKLYRPYRTTFTTQAPHLLYLGAAGNERNRIILASTTGERQILGPDTGLIKDFSVAPDRSQAVFSSRHSAGNRASEIWLLNLSDDSTTRVFEHPGWDISQPHLSPDNMEVVFLATNVRLCQRFYGCTLDKTGPVVYLLSLRSRKVTQFQPNSAVPLTYFIDFSPANQVAYTDLGSALTLATINGRQVIHIPNLGNSPEYAGFDSAGDKAVFVGQTPSSSGGDILVYESHTNRYTDVSRQVYDSSTPSFSTSGTSIAYAGYHGEKGIEPVYGINVYDFATKATRRLTNEKEWSDWAPRWSSDDRYIAFVRSQPQEAMYMGAGEVWVVRSDGTDAHPLGGIGKNIYWVS